tara:strand:- start:237 stop:560 length:324 start_codon:yes stop_codon:yes gene_type:complete
MANVFFFKVRQTSTGNISVITSDKPLSAIKTNDTLGFEVGSRGSSAVFGVFTPRDPQTGKVAAANSAMHKNFSGLTSGQEMPGFRMTSDPVLKEDGSESGMYWVEVE